MLTRDASCHNVPESNMIQMSSQGLHCTAICYISVDNVHGFCPQCTWTNSMDIVHGTFPWTLSMELFHGHCQWNFSMDIVHGFCPLIPWTISMDCGKSPWIPWKSSMDILEKFHGHTGKTPWTFSIDSLEIVQCFRSNTPTGQCPWIPWTLSTDSMDFFHWFHGLSTDGNHTQLVVNRENLWCQRFQDWLRYLSRITPNIATVSVRISTIQLRLRYELGHAQ